MSIARTPERWTLIRLASLLAVLSWAACGAPYEPLHPPPECDNPGDLRCPGSPWPEFTLEDVNAHSPTHGQQVTPDMLAGQVTVMSLFAGW